MVAIVPDPATALKAVLYQTMQRKGLRQSDLAKLLDTNQKEVLQILDPARKTKLARMTQALKLLGEQVVVGLAAWSISLVWVDRLPTVAQLPHY